MDDERSNGDSEGRKLLLEDEDNRFSVYSIVKKGRYGCATECKMIHLPDGPRYELETSADSKIIFLKETRSNKLIRVLHRQGEKYDLTEQEAQKMHYFDKLNLVPRNPSKNPVIKAKQENLKSVISSTTND